MFRTLASYEADQLGLPYPVTLIEGAEEEFDDATGERTGISIPDLDELVIMIALSRAMFSVQLTGGEVKFMRQVIGMSQKAFAEGIAVDPATLSRWENGKIEVGEWADKAVRMAVVLAAPALLPGMFIDGLDVVKLRITKRSTDAIPKIVVRRTSQAADARWDRPALMAA